MRYINDGLREFDDIDGNNGIDPDEAAKKLYNELFASNEHLIYHAHSIVHSSMMIIKSYNLCLFQYLAECMNFFKNCSKYMAEILGRKSCIFDQMF